LKKQRRIIFLRERGGGEKAYQLKKMTREKERDDVSFLGAGSLPLGW
jgi:hypothetical protein